VINAKKKITVDGNLNEWTSEWISLDTKYMTRNPFHYNGKEDFSMQFSTTYDEDYLYVGIKVTDDDWYRDGASTHWNQDVVIVGLDARPSRVSEINNGNGRNRDWLSLMLTMNEENALYQSPGLPEGIQHKIKIYGHEAHAEMAIPIDYLNKMQKEEWQNVRIGLGYFDFDQGGEERNDHMWFPPWNAANTIHGSGMLFRK
jgi:hypothetical protein